MTTPELFVIDTNSLIAYFHDVFKQDHYLSNRMVKVFEAALSPNEGRIKVSIPSIVFVEIFEKWFRDQEFERRFYFEVFYPIKESPNIEIKPIDKEVLHELLSIKGILINHDLHDKIILASAISAWSIEVNKP